MTHHVSRDQAEVDDDGGEGEEVAGAVVFMDPAAEVLQYWRGGLELFSEGQEQQQNVGEQEDGELEDDWEQPAEVDKEKRKEVRQVVEIFNHGRIKKQEEVSDLTSGKNANLSTCLISFLTTTSSDFSQ